MRTRRATYGGVASPACMRPQVFSTSRRFAPFTPLRACFIPVALLGFGPFRGFPLRAAGHLSAGHAPLGVGPLIGPHLQGFEQSRRSVLAPERQLSRSSSRSSPGLLPLQGMSLPATAHAFDVASPRALFTVRPERGVSTARTALAWRSRVSVYWQVRRALDCSSSPRPS